MEATQTLERVLAVMIDRGDVRTEFGTPAEVAKICLANTESRITPSLPESPAVTDERDNYTLGIVRINEHAVATPLLDALWNIQEVSGVPGLRWLVEKLIYIGATNSRVIINAYAQKQRLSDKAGKGFAAAEFDTLQAGGSTM